ncbi:MAG: hypothetical protein EOP39_16610 [Rubrivivax sp.]|nr:MAG: hypothetical protein EOP39_16610 [Rubrivivax sp.]
MAADERFHSLDAVRACALLAGILLHALMSYMPGIREVNWPLADASTSPGLGILYFVIHLLRMTLFFVIAGFFARLLHERLGTKGFIKNRLRRIGLPLIAFMFLAMPLIVIAIIWGARQLGIKGPPKMEAPFPLIGPPVPWGHLWFLYALLVIYVVVLVSRAVIVAVDGKGARREAFGGLVELAFKWRLAPLVFSAPIAASLFASPWWVEWQGIPSPIMGLVPNFPALLAYGGAVLVGWFLHRQQACLHMLAADWPIYLVGALAGSLVALYIGGITPKFKPLGLAGGERALYTFAYVFAQWCWSFALIGLAMRRFTSPSARWRYLADASYWMYLVHLPVVMLLQAWMLGWPLPWPVKLSLNLAMTGAVLIASYHYLVRGTFMGQFLNGRKRPRAPAAAALQMPAG